jgi:hypothetical protein
VADYMGGLWRVATATNQVLGRTQLPGRAEAVGFGRVWVTNELGTVSTLDPASGAVLGDPIPVGADADGVSITSDAVWAVALYGQTLARIDPASRTVGRAGQDARTGLGRASGRRIGLGLELRPRGGVALRRLCRPLREELSRGGEAARAGRVGRCDLGREPVEQLGLRIVP